jgi:hypothetical protein
MGWLEGLLTGYAGTLGDIRRENARAAELSANREGDVFKALLNSDNPEIRGMAATGLLSSTQPKRVKGGFGGWMGEMEANPMYPQLMKYINTPQRTVTETTVPGLPSRQTQGFLPASAVPGQTPLAQPTTSPTEGEPMEAPQPLPGSVQPPPPSGALASRATLPFYDDAMGDEQGHPAGQSPQLGRPPALPSRMTLNPYDDALGDAQGHPSGQQPVGATGTFSGPPPAPPAIGTSGTTETQGPAGFPTSPEGTRFVQQLQAPARPGEGGWWLDDKGQQWTMVNDQILKAGQPPVTPPPAPPILDPRQAPLTPGPAVGRVDRTETYALPHAFPTAEETAIKQRRAIETGDFEALTDVARRSGQANPEKWAADLIASSKLRAGQSIHEGDARQDANGNWVQDLYDNTGRVIGQIPAGAKGAGRALTSREQIAYALFGKAGEDPLQTMHRLTPPQSLQVLQEQGILDTENKLRTANMMANAPLSTAAKSELIEKLNTKWTTLQKPQRVMAQALNEMQVGVNRLEADPIGASQAVLITFQKILDPTSVVRESEYARSAEGLPLVSRIEGMYDRLVKGGAGVPKEELSAMAETARQFLLGMQHFNDGERQRIEDRAAQNGIDPGYIFGGGVTAPPPAPPPGFAPPPPGPPAATAAPGAAGGRATVGKNAKGQTTITIQ